MAVNDPHQLGATRRRSAPRWIGWLLGALLSCWLPSASGTGWPSAAGAGHHRRLLQEQPTVPCFSREGACSSQQDNVHIVEVDLVDKECVVMHNAWFDGPVLPPPANTSLASELDCCVACFDTEGCSVWTYCDNPRGCSMPNDPSRQLPYLGCRLIALPNFHPVVNSSTSFRVMGEHVPFMSGAPFTLSLPKVPGYQINPGVDLNSQFDYSCPQSPRGDVCEVAGSAAELANLCNADNGCKGFVYLPNGLDFKSSPIGILKGGGVNHIPLSALAVNPSTALFIKDTVVYGPRDADSSNSGGSNSSTKVLVIVVPLSVAVVVMAAVLGIILLRMRRAQEREQQAQQHGAAAGGRGGAAHGPGAQLTPGGQVKLGGSAAGLVAGSWSQRAVAPASKSAGETTAAGAAAAAKRDVGPPPTLASLRLWHEAAGAAALQAEQQRQQQMQRQLAAGAGWQRAGVLQRGELDSPRCRELLLRFGEEASGSPQMESSCSDEEAVSVDGSGASATYVCIGMHSVAAALLGGSGPIPSHSCTPTNSTPSASPDTSLEPPRQPPQQAQHARLPPLQAQRPLSIPLQQQHLQQQQQQQHDGGPGQLGAPTATTSSSSPNSVTMRQPLLGMASIGLEGSSLGSRELPQLPWSDWVLQPEEVEICRHPDSSWWQLGSGAFGTVYKGLYHGLQPVAVKVLHADTDPRVLQEFVKEITLLKSLRDRNIVQFLGASLEGASAMLVTEFMELGDLWRALPLKNAAGERIFSWERRGRRVALDVARGLHYLHFKRIVHLDLKSANILLSRHGTAKIGDIGMARVLTQEWSMFSGTAGTWAWSAPEVLSGRRCTEKVDCFSFGIVLWEICTGEVPVRGGMRPLQAPQDCPQAVVELQARCTSESPEERPSAAELVQLLTSLQ